MIRGVTLVLFAQIARSVLGRVRILVVEVDVLAVAQLLNLAFHARLDLRLASTEVLHGLGLGLDSLGTQIMLRRVGPFRVDHLDLILAER